MATQYCFGTSDRRVEANGFDPTFHRISYAAGTSSVMMRNMNWIMQLVQSLPESISCRLSLEFSSFVIAKRVRS